MLKAWRNQLNALAVDPADLFTTKIRRLVGPRAAVLYGQKLRRMIQFAPDMTGRIHRRSEKPGLSPLLMHWSGYVLSYLYNPKNFLSEKTPGLFGYLDDAYILARVFDRTLRETETPGRPRKGELARDVPEWIEMTRHLLPRETSKIDRTLDNLKDRA